MKKHLLMLPFLAALAGTGFSQCPIADQNISDATTSVCDGAQIKLANSETGVNYFLRNSANDSIIQGPLSGSSGNELVFTGKSIKNATTYNVYAATQQTNGLHFNGVDQFVLATNDEALQTDQGTYEAWLKTEDAGSNFRGIVVKQLAGSIFLYNNELGFYDWTRGWLGTGITINDGAWHHVALTYENGVESGAVVYLDGKPVLTNTLYIYSQSEALAIGNGYDTQIDQNFNGNISEVRIWNTVRTAEDIFATYATSLGGNEKGLVSYYQFSDGTGSAVLTDRTGGLNAILLETMNPADVWVEGPTEFSRPSCSLELSGIVSVSVKNSKRGIDQQKACDMFTWIDGITYNGNNTTATYNLEGGSANGCDSLVTLNLKVSYSTHGTDKQQACGAYTWIDGDTYTSSNSTAKHILLNHAGCDSIVTLQLSLTRIPDETLLLSTAAICDSGSVSVSTTASSLGASYYLRTETGRYLDTLAGTGSALDFKALKINSTTTFNVYAIAPVADPYLEFDGSDDYVGLSNSSNIPVGNSNYTIEAWIKPQATGANGIVGWGPWGSGNQVNAFRFDGSSTLINYWWGNDLYVNVPDMNDGIWHHVAATFDGTIRSIYLDGKLAGSDEPSGHDVSSADNFRIGSTNNGEYYKGGIKEIRIWNMAKTETELSSAMNNTLSGTETGLVAYYLFKKEADATLVNDLAGGDNTGTLTNADAETAWVNSAGNCTLQMTSTPKVTVNKKSEIDLTLAIASDVLTANGQDAAYQWLFCSPEMKTIDGENKQRLIGPNAGSYAVILTVGACIDTTSCVELLVTGIQGNSLAASVRLYPNPTAEFVTIDLGNMEASANYRLTTLEGKIIYEGKVAGNIIQLSLKEQSKGFYLLRLNQEGTVTNYKILKQ